MQDFYQPVYIEALQLLQNLSSSDGIYASQESTTNYRSVFTRDAMMAGISGLLIADDKIISSWLSTLRNLKKRQGPQGQIASNYQPGGKVSYGSLTPRIDSVTWYILGVSLAIKHGFLRQVDWVDSIDRAVGLLDALEYNGKSLIYIPMGGNWADEYPYSGYVLYDQALRLWALREAGEVFYRMDWGKKASKIAEVIVVNYKPRPKAAGREDVYHQGLFDKTVKHLKPYFFSSFSPVGYRDAFDLAAHSLLAMALQAFTHSSIFAKDPKPDPSSSFHLVHTGLNEAFNWINTTFISNGELPPVFYPVITEGSSDWEALQNYHLFNFRNKPFHYHNGGIWPIWIGWFGLALASFGKGEQFNNLMHAVEKILKENAGYNYQEYFDGKYKQAGGTSRMAYSATGFIMLEVAQNHLKKSTVQ